VGQKTVNQGRRSIIWCAFVHTKTPYVRFVVPDPEALSTNALASNVQQRPRKNSMFHFVILNHLELVASSHHLPPFGWPLVIYSSSIAISPLDSVDLLKLLYPSLPDPMKCTFCLWNTPSRK